ncbi:MAG: DedA family protein [Syntrophobacteraceae bacterium]
MEETLLHWISQYGYIAIFSLLMFGIIGLPIPDEVMLTFSGYLIFKGQLAMFPTIASAFLGSICGVSISYWLGRSGGRLLIARYGHKVHITTERIERVRQWLNHAGRWGLTLGYFIPGVRHLTALVAGTSQLKYSVFATFAYTGGLLWSATFIALGFFVGKEWFGTSAAIRRWMFIALAAIASILLVYYFASRKTHKNA